MKIGSDDISKIYLGSEEISKIYLGSNIVYEASSPTPPGQEDIYMNGKTMVVRAGTQMELYTQSSTETYTLSEDITIPDLLSEDSGTLTNLDTYMYYPDFEAWFTDGISSIQSTEYTGGITIDGVSYSHSSSFGSSNYYCTFWWAAFTDGLFENTAFTGGATWDVFGTGNGANTYCIAKCTGSPNTTYRIVSDDILNPKDRSNSWPKKTIENITMIVHTNADPQDSTGYISKQTGRTLKTYSYSCYLDIEDIQFTTDSTGEFYVTFCVPNNNMSDPGFLLNGSIGFKSRIKRVDSLFNTPLGIDLMAGNWQGEGHPNEIQMSFHILDYSPERFKYLITVQADGSAVITNNPNYQPT